MSARPKLGFIGLGAMGRPMALNLMKAGYAMTVYARRAQALEPLVAAGARTAANPADVARAADVVFSLVTASADSEAVALGTEGLIEGARDGSVVIDMATISPLATRRIAQAPDFLAGLRLARQRCGPIGMRFEPVVSTHRAILRSPVTGEDRRLALKAKGLVEWSPHLNVTPAETRQ